MYIGSIIYCLPSLTDKHYLSLHYYCFQKEISGPLDLIETVHAMGQLLKSKDKKKQDEAVNKTIEPSLLLTISLLIYPYQGLQVTLCNMNIGIDPSLLW